MTRSYYRTSSPATALPMITRWISDVPSKIVKILEALVLACPLRRGLPVLVALLLITAARPRMADGWRPWAPGADDARSYGHT
jgi:hypothetical protein